MDEIGPGRGYDVKPHHLHYQWVIFGILTFSHLLMAMFFFGWGPLAPILKEELHVSNSQIGLIVSTMYFAMMLVSVPAGFLVDKFGARGMLLLSVSLVGLATCALSLSSGSLIPLFLVPAIGGAGYGMINQVTTKGLMYWFEPHKRATIMGIKQTGVTIGGSLIGLYIPFCAQVLGWRRGLLLLAIALFLMPIFSLFLYREKPSIPVDPLSDGKRPAEGRDVRLLLLRPLVMGLTLLFACYAACQSCVVAFLVVYTEEAFRLTHVTAGSLLTVMMVAGTISRVVFGLVSDRLMHGDRVAPMAVLALIGMAGLLLLTRLNPHPPLFLLYLISVLLGTSLVGWNGLAITLIAEIGGHELVGSIMGVVFTIAWSGMVLAPPTFGWIVDAAGYTTGWLLLTGLIGITCAGFAGISLTRRKA